MTVPTSWQRASSARPRFEYVPSSRWNRVGVTLPKGHEAGEVVETCSLPATALGMVYELGPKRVTVDLTIGKNPEEGPKSEPRVGITAITMKVEGDGIGEVLTQTELAALPFHAMAIEAVQYAIEAGPTSDVDPTAKIADLFLRPSMTMARRQDAAHDRYRRAIEAAEDAKRNRKTVWRAVADACPRVEPARADLTLNTSENAQRQAAKRLLSRAKALRAEGVI